MSVEQISRKAERMRRIRRRSVRANVKLTRRKRLIILRAIANRLPLKKAAEFAGVSYNTIYMWMQRGKDPEKNPLVYYFFRRKVKRIQAKIEKECLNVIKDAQKGGANIIDTTITFGPKGTEIKRTRKTMAPQWKAAAWFLERRFDYGKDADVEAIAVSAEDLALEVRHLAKELFESVPIYPEAQPA